AADVRGNWDGFYLDASSSIGLVRSDITRQVGRRLTGQGQLLDASTDHLLASYTFNGRITPDDIIVGSGSAPPSGRVSLESTVQFYAGEQGHSGVLDAQLTFAPRSGLPFEVNALLLHPFPDTRAPHVAGDGLGVFRSSLDPTFAGNLTLAIK